MLTRTREKTLRHWEDPTLLHVVHQDLLRKSGWSDVRAVSLDLPPCGCCLQDSSSEPAQQESGRESRERANESNSNTTTCSTTAHGMAGTVREEESGNRDAPETKVVFAVNAGCAIPTRRLSDVVAAAEAYLRLNGRRTHYLEEGYRSRVLAAFCDGSSIIYYTVSGGIDTS